MLEQPIVDAHVHLSSPAPCARRCLDALPALDRPFGLAEYQDQTRGLPITGMVFVETGVAPHYALLEAQWAASLAGADPRLLGVVAAAPLDDGTRIRAYLDALAALGQVVKGVGRNLQDESDAEICLRAGFVQGVRLLADYGFSCDLCIRHHQLPAVTALARACPGVVFVLDHLGKPPIEAHQLDPWRDQLAALGALPNVARQVSGVGSEAGWRRWPPAGPAPCVSHTLWG